MTVSKYGLPDGKDRVVASFRSLSLADIKGMIVRAAEQGIVKAANAKFHVKHFRKELVSEELDQILKLFADIKQLIHVLDEKMSAMWRGGY